MSRDNKVVVLIPSYNGGESLLDTLASIDPLEEVDVLVVDDGSKVRPVIQELESAFKANGRVILHCLEYNQGVIGALNCGLDVARECGYQYVARLDAGDRNVGLRFRQQAQFLDNNCEYALVGAWVDFVSVSGELLFTLKHPEKHEDIEKAIFRYNPFVHPATMFRLDEILALGGYPVEYPALEDWACFLAVSKRHKVANLPNVLLEYEVNPESISSKKRYAQSRSKVKLLFRNYKPNLNQTIGLLKNFAIMFFPRGVLTFVKRMVLNGRVA